MFHKNITSLSLLVAVAKRKIITKQCLESVSLHMHAAIQTLYEHYRVIITVNAQKFRTLFSLFSNKILVFKAGIHKVLVRIANREHPDQTASSEAV